jgi:hypothetical protein
MKNYYQFVEVSIKIIIYLVLCCIMILAHFQKLFFEQYIQVYSNEGVDESSRC